MYGQLFNTVTDAIDELKNIQQKTEEMIDSKEAEQETMEEINKE